MLYDLQEYFFFFLELPNWDFGVEIGAEVPETLKYTVAHWGPLARCLEKGSGQSVPPVLGKTIWQLGTLQKRAFKKAPGQMYISPAFSAQRHPCPAPGSVLLGSHPVPSICSPTRGYL